MESSFKIQLAAKLAGLQEQRDSAQHFVEEVFNITKNLSEIDLGDLDRIEVFERGWGNLIIRFSELERIGTFSVITRLMDGQLDIKVLQPTANNYTFVSLKDYQTFLIKWVTGTYGLKIKELGE